MSDENEEGSKGSGLRKQLEDALAAIEDLKGQVETGTAAQRELAFVKAGIDPAEGVGKLLAKTYDGDLTTESIQAFAEEYGVADLQSAAPAKDQTQQRMDQLRAASTPDGAGKRMSHTEFLELTQTDPGAARAAHGAGMVDMPAGMAQQLDTNRGSARLG